MSFQTQVNQYPAPAVEGDFADQNPRASVLAGAAALVAPTAGTTIGRFAWVVLDDNSQPYQAANTGEGQPAGFVHREQQALITTFLAQASMTVPEGLPVTLMDAGSFWARSSNGADYNQKVFANFADGTVYCDDAGATPNGSAITASTATDVLTVTVTSEPILVGSKVVGAGIPANTYITAQLTGTPGSTGTYSLSTTPGTVGSESMTTEDAIETVWFAKSAAGNNELVKISTWG